MAEFGERIAARRQQLGWNQIQLAAAAGLTPSAISLFESGKRKPSFQALKKLSEALGVPADYLTDEGPQATNTDVSDPRLKGLIDGFSLLDNTGRDKMLESALALLTRLAGGTHQLELSSDPRQAARELLDQLGQHYPPVDPLLIVSLLGVSVRLAHLSQLDCGAILDRRIDPPVMLVARPKVEPGKPLNTHRLRFSIAHLLAHHVLPHHRGLTYRCRSLMAGAGDDPVEKEANEFAAELLMSAPMLQRVQEPRKRQIEPETPMKKALDWTYRFNVSVPVGVLQWVRGNETPCVALLTEGAKIREIAIAPSFPHELLGAIPSSALCITTINEIGIQRRTCPDQEWLATADGLLVNEEAYHYNGIAAQSVSLLTLGSCPWNETQVP